MDLGGPCQTDTSLLSFRFNVFNRSHPQPSLNYQPRK
jgi:hypothetical protein